MSRSAQCISGADELREIRVLGDPASGPHVESLYSLQAGCALTLTALGPGRLRTLARASVSPVPDQFGGRLRAVLLQYRTTRQLECR
jgi:hypothetical protein